MVVDLAKSREKIDAIDKEIARLFEERMRVATDVAAYKKSTGKKVFDPQREEEKIAALRELTDNEFNKVGIEDLFRQIMSISRKYQYRMLDSADEKGIPFMQVDEMDVDAGTKVVFFGEHGAFTEQAKEEIFGSDVTSFRKEKFRDIVEAVSKGDAKYGVLPIENTSTGGIADIYDLLVEYDVTIVAEHVVRVEQDLLALPEAKFEDIKKVYSHPQGILQSAKFLSDNPQIVAENFSSTSGAAKKVAEEKDITQAAIASSRAGEYFGLQVLKKGINFENQNYTRFIVISNEKIFLSDAEKISLCFEIKHQAGALYNMLANFYYNGLNLTKIESRPMENRNWEYRFFVELEGNLNASEVRNALASIEECASQVRILGTIAKR